MKKTRKTKKVKIVIDERVLKAIDENLTNKNPLQVVQFWTIGDIVRKIIKQKITLPVIQRNIVYNDKDKSSIIIELILNADDVRNMIVHPIVIVTDGITFYVCDGQQRLTSIVQFVKEHEEFEYLIEKMLKKYRDLKFLNLKANEEPLKLKLKENVINTKNEKNLDIKSLNGCYFLDLPEELQEKFLDFLVPVIVYNVPTEKLMSETIRIYNKLNEGKPLNAEEKQVSKFCDSILFQTVKDVIYNEDFETNVNYNWNKDRYKMLNVGIDTFNIFNDHYNNGNRKERENSYRRYASDRVASKIFKENFLNAFEIGKLIFPEGKVFSEFGKKGKWKRCTIATAIPWIVAIKETLITERNQFGLYTKEDFKNHAENILNEWKKINFPNGHNTETYKVSNGTILEWTDLVTDQSNNKENVYKRIELLKNMFAYCIKK